MRLGILSDTHDRIGHVRIALNLFRGLKCDLLLHAGDYCSPFMIPLFEKWELHGVFGNNDGDHYRLQQKFSAIGAHLHGEFMDREIGGRRIAMYHGTQPGITDALVRCGTYDLVVTGHTHQAENRLLGRTLHLNPGSCHGFEGVATVAIYDTDSGVGEVVGV